MIEWNYFLSIEKDLVDSFQYVHPCSSNLSVYSTAFAKILLMAASEVDSVLKMLCCEWGLSKCRNIKDYSAAIRDKAPYIMDSQVRCLTNCLACCPWGGLKDEGSFSPQWWKAYNEVKHDLGANFEKATFENAFYAVSALLVVLVALYKTRGNTFVDPAPRMLEIAASYAKRDLSVGTGNIILSIDFEKYYVGQKELDRD